MNCRKMKSERSRKSAMKNFGNWNCPEKSCNNSVKQILNKKTVEILTVKIVK
jgi:hypothetical protein